MNKSVLIFMPYKLQSTYQKLISTLKQIQIDQLSYSMTLKNTQISLLKFHSLYSSICVSTVLSLDLGRFCSFLILHTVGRSPWSGDQPVARPLPTHKINANIDIHASSWIRTHDPSVRVSEDSSCLTPRGHSDRQISF
jgi:hypothetical protein